MATEIIVDRGGLDGFDWDSQAVGLYAAGGLLGASTGGAAKRAGVVPAVGTPLKYILSAGLVGNLKAGVFAIPHPDTSLGVHFAVLPADFLITHTTAHGSQPRTDLIIVELNDVGTSSSTTKFRLLTGTAGAGTPALPTSLGNGAAFTLASVNVPALATTLGTITDSRTFTAGAGGMVPVANLAAASGLPIGTPYFDLALDRPGVVRASGAGLITPAHISVAIFGAVASGTVDADMSKAKIVGGMINRTTDANGFVSVTTGLSQYILTAWGSCGDTVSTFATTCSYERSLGGINDIYFRVYVRSGDIAGNGVTFPFVWGAIGL